MGHVNLLPAAMIVRRRRRQRTRLWTVITSAYGVALLLTCAVLKVVTAPGQASATTELESLDKRERASQIQLRAFEQQLRVVSAKLDTRRTMAVQPDWSQLLALLGTCTERDMTIRQLLLKGSGVDPERLSTGAGSANANTEREPRHFTLMLEGITRNEEGSLRLVTKLRDLGLFNSVEIKRKGQDQTGATTANSFEIACVFSDSTQVPK